jgi:hypothetical protein
LAAPADGFADAVLPLVDGHVVDAASGFQPMPDELVHWLESRTFASFEKVISAHCKR